MYESVNKLLTFIKHNCKRTKEENSLLSTLRSINLTLIIVIIVVVFNSCWMDIVYFLQNKCGTETDIFQLHFRLPPRPSLSQTPLPSLDPLTQPPLPMTPISIS